MGLQFRSLTMLFLLIWFFWWPRVESQIPGPNIIHARALDAILQDYAYRAFVRPRTGIPYDGAPPLNLSGIDISAMRLRSGSLFTRGVPSYKEFTIPVGVIEHPYVERLVLVYQNLRNWSDTYYPLPGYTYLAPVLGLLAYDASNLSAKNLPELDIRASDEPISIKFTQMRTMIGSTARCVSFDLNNQKSFTNVVSGNRCLTIKQGHFSIVVESTAPSPAPLPPAPEAPTPSHGGKKSSRVGIIVGSAVGGVALLVLLALLVLWVWKFSKKKKMHRMEKAADAGEALHMTTVGNTKAPAATMTRTQPTLETEYVP